MSLLPSRFLRSPKPERSRATQGLRFPSPLLNINRAHNENRLVAGPSVSSTDSQPGNGSHCRAPAGSRRDVGSVDGSTTASAQSRVYELSSVELSVLKTFRSF